MPRGPFALLYIAFLVYFENFENVQCKSGPSILDLMIVALHRDIKFMYERPEQMNVDAIFGLNFVQGLGAMIRPEIWNRTIFWRRGELGEKSLRSRSLMKAKSVSLINQGTPSESESLRCFIDLLVQYEKLSCKVPKECWDMLVRNDSPRGYPLTHRLLYVQLASALGCEDDSKREFMEMKKTFCAAILQDLFELESINFPSFSRDLVMEQIVVCGMEGYLEFIEKHYAELIAGWPNSYGCYSAFGFDREQQSRERRSTSRMDYGCDNHASAVAAASLSLLVRSALENSISEFL